MKKQSRKFLFLIALFVSASAFAIDFGWGDDSSYTDPASDGRFWGNGEWQCGSCNNGIRNCYRRYYIFWMKAGTETNLRPC
jgi:hypothetical protein